MCRITALPPLYICTRYPNRIALPQMSQPHIFTKDEIDKIGNTLIYFADRIPHLSKTKLLKFVYAYYKFRFEVWQYGPVAKDLFADPSSTEQYLFRDYVGASQDAEGRVYISSKKAFDDDAFSDSELSLMEEVVNRFGQLTAKELEALLSGEAMTTDHKKRSI